MKLVKYLIFVLIIFIIIGCGSGSSSSDNNNTDKKNNFIQQVLDIPILIQMDSPDAVDLDTEALKELAVKYRAISSRLTQFTPNQVDVLKNTNINLIVLKYLNFATGYAVVDDAWRREHLETVLKTSNGSLCRGLINGDNSIVMDPSNQFWRETLINASVSAVTEGHFDGIMADQLVMANKLANDFDCIYSKTGKPYTTEEWRQEMLELIAEVKNAIKDKLLIGNSVANGVAYFQENTRQFLTSLDGVVAEGFKGSISWNTSIYPDQNSWQKNLDMMNELNQLNKYGIAIAKYDDGKINSNIEFVQNYRFNLCTFLLIKYDLSGFSVIKIKKNQNNVQIDSPYMDEYSLKLGSPTGNYFFDNGLAMRNFSNGMVIVNPTDNEHTYSLPQEYVDWDNNTLSSITLPANNSVILLEPN